MKISMKLQNFKNSLIATAHLRTLAFWIIMEKDLLDRNLNQQMVLELCQKNIVFQLNTVETSHKTHIQPQEDQCFQGIQKRLKNKIQLYILASKDSCKVHLRVSVLKTKLLHPNKLYLVNQFLRTILIKIISTEEMKFSFLHTDHNQWRVSVMQLRLKEKINLEI